MLYGSDILIIHKDGRKLVKPKSWGIIEERRKGKNSLIKLKVSGLQVLLNGVECWCKDSADSREVRYGKVGGRSSRINLRPSEAD